MTKDHSVLAVSDWADDKLWLELVGYVCVEGCTQWANLWKIRNTSYQWDIKSLCKWYWRRRKIFSVFHFEIDKCKYWSDSSINIIITPFLLSSTSSVFLLMKESKSLHLPEVGSWDTCNACAYSLSFLLMPIFALKRKIFLEAILLSHFYSKRNQHSYQYLAIVEHLLNSVTFQYLFNLIYFHRNKYIFFSLFILTINEKMK